MIGTTISHYRILEKLGGGGMGVVYRAIDTRLDRSVALKFLTLELSHDGDAKQRFIREAKAASALDHPNICALYDIGESEDGQLFLVMPHYPGETLKKRIERGPLPLSEALRIAAQIAEGLDKAHGSGIVHRDIKPANVMLSDDGGVKIVDFGLAKLVGAASLTGSGTAVGTPAYMSPEQIRGQVVDARADLWALGVVLYEMVTGQKPYRGESDQAMIHSILNEQSDPIDAYRAEVPEDLEKIIRKLLQKDTKRRYQSARELASDLRNWSDASRTLPRVIASRTIWWRRPLFVGLTAAALLTVLLLTITRMRQGALAGNKQLRATFTQITDQPGIESWPTISPDGKFVAYVVGGWLGASDIYLQRIGGHNPVNLTANSPTADYQPAFSRDGEQIAFRSEREGGGIFVMGATGESVRRVSDLGYNPSWSPDGKNLVVSSQLITANPLRGVGSKGELWTLEVASGRKSRITSFSLTPIAESETPLGVAKQPSWSPHGHRIAFWGTALGRYQWDIFTVPAGGGEAVRVTNDSFNDHNPIWSPDGRSIYFCSDRAGSMNLWRVAVDENTGKPQGEPEPLTTPARWAGALSISSDGKRIAYCARDARSNILRINLDSLRETVVGHPEEVTHGTMFVTEPDVSPDGKRIVFRSDFQQIDLYSINGDGSDLKKLTDDPAIELSPTWSPDGHRIAFFSNRGGSAQIYVINVDGSGVQQITNVRPPGGYPRWSPDGQRMSINAQNECKSGTCIVDLSGKQLGTTIHPIPEFAQGWLFVAHQWSQDGKKLVGIAGRSNVSEYKLCVYSFETGKYDVLVDNALAATRWMGDNRNVVFVRNNKIYRIDIETKVVKQLFAPNFRLDDPEISVSKDGRTIYFLHTSDEADIWLATLN